jgi:hypothetical protein
MVNPGRVVSARHRHGEFREIGRPGVVRPGAAEFDRSPDLRVALVGPDTPVQFSHGLTQVGSVRWMSSRLGVVEASEAQSCRLCLCIDPRDPLMTDLPHLEPQ